MIGFRIIARILPLLMCASLSSLATAKTFYVDCSGSNVGIGSRTSPFNALASINGLTFAADDRILLRASTTCVGQLELHGSGRPGHPITLSRYGVGNKPIIDANGAVGAVIRLLNVEQWEISGLELRNDGPSPDYRSGIVAENSSTRVLRHVSIDGMTIANIRGWPGGWYSRNAGVAIQTDHTSPKSTWDDIRISNNVLHHIDRIAIAVTPDHDGEGTGLTRHLVIQGNHIDNSGGDDILLVKGIDALISNNTASAGGFRSVIGCPPSGQYCNRASASIWVAGSDDTVIKKNEVSCYVNEADGQAFDVDWGNRNTLIEGNYSHQNRGGFLLLMPAIHVRGEPRSTVPSSGTVVRYNVSDRDTVTTGCTLQPRTTGPSSVFHLTGDVPNRSNDPADRPLIYNNTIVLPAEATANIIGSREGSTVKGSLIFANNIVVNHGTGGYVETSGSIFTHNLFAGSAPSTEPASGHTIRQDPLFVGGSSADAFRLRPRSPARATGEKLQSIDPNAKATNSSRPSIGAYP